MGMTLMSEKIINAMTVDVEDYFQVSAFEKTVLRPDWDKIPHRVEDNTNRILDQFAENNVKATFFMLGWVAERYPLLIKRIIEEGHELASHGYCHVRVTQQTASEFRNDISKTKKLLEDLAGVEIKGYRAASYSINAGNLWAIDELAETGHLYSSSIYPIKHDLYGMPQAPRFPFQHEGSGLLEIPITTVMLGKQKLPCGGGGFFRLFPYSYSRWAINRINNIEKQSALFYFHPWEIDAGQPRFINAPWKSRFRHYHNLNKMEERLQRLMQEFSWGRMDQIFLEQ
jgi:polysaccharide deacetylase family protein (PEP-CTERM system associated)